MTTASHSDSKAADVKALLQSARDDDTLGDGAHAVLSIIDLGQKIGDALGLPADQFQQSETVLVGLLADDSYSITAAGNAQAVRDGNNLILDAVGASKQQDNILAHIRLLNGTILSPFCRIDQAVRLNAQNYDPRLGTPLYDESVAFLGTMLTKAQEFAAQGVPCRTISLIITDGADQHSKQFRAADVKKIVCDLLRQEQHIVAAMGIDDGGNTDFRFIFREMGIRDEWILTPKSSPSEIRKACQVFSQSAVRASQSAGSFSQQALGGFGA